MRICPENVPAFASMLQDLEIIVGRHEALQLDAVTGQLHHADLVAVSVRPVHTHADKRQFPVRVLGVDARAFRLHHKPRLFQHILVTVKDFFMGARDYFSDSVFGSTLVGRGPI